MACPDTAGCAGQGADLSFADPEGINQEEAAVVVTMRKESLLTPTGHLYYTYRLCNTATDLSNIDTDPTQI